MNLTLKNGSRSPGVSGPPVLMDPCFVKSSEQKSSSPTSLDYFLKVGAVICEETHKPIFDVDVLDSPGLNPTIASPLTITDADSCVCSHLELLPWFFVSPLLLTTVPTCLGAEKTS